MVGAILQAGAKVKGLHSCHFEDEKIVALRLEKAYQVRAGSRGSRRQGESLQRGAPRCPAPNCRHRPPLHLLTPLAQACIHKLPLNLQLPYDDHPLTDAAAAAAKEYLEGGGGASPTERLSGILCLAQEAGSRCLDTKALQASVFTASAVAREGTWMLLARLLAAGASVPPAVLQRLQDVDACLERMMRDSALGFALFITENQGESSTGWGRGACKLGSARMKPHPSLPPTALPCEALSAVCPTPARPPCCRAPGPLRQPV